MAQEAPLEAGPSQVDYETVFTNKKAGMEEVDAEHVKRVVYEASKGSAHYANEQRKERIHKQRIQGMLAMQRSLTAADLARHTASMDAKLAALEATRDLTRTWLHVDMDAFFAAVEERNDPRLRNKPFAVGGIGMISTANYVARKTGVRSAMPGFIALRLCPNLIFVSGCHDKYRAASEETHAVLRAYDPCLRASSLDEASLDVTDICRARGMTGWQVAQEIRERMKRETGLTCSVGIGPNRMLAKICSDRNKPDGQFQVESSREAVMGFMRDLPVRSVSGVGRVSQRVLQALGIVTCGDLITHRGVLQPLLSPIACDFFAHVALGLGSTRHEPPPAEGQPTRKGISTERTFRAISALPDMEARLRDLAAALEADMAREGLRGRTVTLKLKLTSFEIRTRAVTLGHAIGTSSELYQAAHGLLVPQLPCELRLMGLRVSGFVGEQRRERGQLTIEEMLGRLQPNKGYTGQEGVDGAAAAEQGAGGSCQQQAEEEGAEGWEGEGAWGDFAWDQRDADLVELSLRDWGAEEAGRGGDTPRDPSLRDWGPQAAGGGPLAAAPRQGDELDRSAPPGPAGLAAAAQHEAGGRAVAVVAAPGMEAGRGAAGGGWAQPGPWATAASHGAMQAELAAGQRGSTRGGRGDEAPGQQAPQTGQAQPPPQVQAGGGGAVPPAPQPPPTWTCSACAAANPKAVFWCAACGASKAQVGGAARRARRAAPAPSILKFVSRQPSPPAGDAHVAQQQQQQQQQGGATGGEGQQGEQGEQAEGGTRSDDGWSESGEWDSAFEPTPRSRLLPGEDVMQCSQCGALVRETLFEEHLQEHEQERARQRADKFRSLFAGGAGRGREARGGQGGGQRRGGRGSAGRASGGQTVSGKKRVAGSSAGGKNGKQSALLTSFLRPAAEPTAADS